MRHPILFKSEDTKTDLRYVFMFSAGQRLITSKIKVCVHNISVYCVYLLCIYTVYVYYLRKICYIYIYNINYMNIYICKCM